MSGVSGDMTGEVMASGEPQDRSAPAQTASPPLVPQDQGRGGPYAQRIAPRPARTVWCCTCDGSVEIGPHNHLADNPDHYIVEAQGEFHVWRNPSATGEEAARERAHWWNQGAKAERRRIEQERSQPEGYRIALRPERDGQDPALMDDIVVKGVSMFRAEAMGDGEWFACCYLEGSDDRIAWWISAKCRPRRIEWITTEHPDVPYEDQSGDAGAHDVTRAQVGQSTSTEPPKGDTERTHPR